MTFVEGQKVLITRAHPTYGIRRGVVLKLHTGFGYYLIECLPSRTWFPPHELAPVPALRLLAEVAE